MKKTVFSNKSRKYQKLNELESLILSHFEQDFESINFKEV